MENRAGNTTTVRGVISQLNGDFVDVEIAQGGCGRCHEAGGCGGQHLTQMFCGGPRSYRVRAQPGLKVGQSVEVVMDASTVRRSATLAYTFPVLALLAGALIGSGMGGDVGGGVGALLGLVASWFWLRLKSTRLAESGVQPHIVFRS